MATLVDNKKAHFNYEIMDKLEAGIELLGFEVKSLKKGQGSLDGSHVLIRGGEAFVVNMTIPPYQEKNVQIEYDSRRNRKLILNRNEIRKLGGVDAKKGLTVVPISVYNKGNLLKVSIAIVRGKKKYDKRASITKRETDRAVRREFVDR